MYCSNCGAPSNTPGLRYCKTCGANLNTTNAIAESAPMTPRPTRITGAAWAIAMATTAITLGGLGIIFSTIEEIVRIPPYAPGVPRNPAEIIPVVVPMVVFGTATVFLIAFMLMRLFTRLMHLPQEPKHSEKTKQPAAYDYRASQPSVPQPQLHAPPISVPSVTEHTTRNFDPIPSMEQKARE
jgi:hypothetical protein